MSLESPEQSSEIAAHFVKSLIYWLDRTRGYPGHVEREMGTIRLRPTDHTTQLCAIDQGITRNEKLIPCNIQK
jgi:hypothetical protein